jgi:hypothetical protein
MWQIGGEVDGRGGRREGSRMRGSGWEKKRRAREDPRHRLPARAHPPLVLRDPTATRRRRRWGLPMLAVKLDSHPARPQLHVRRLWARSIRHCRAPQVPPRAALRVPLPVSRDAADMHKEGPGEGKQQTTGGSRWEGMRRSARRRAQRRAGSSSRSPTCSG